MIGNTGPTVPFFGAYISLDVIDCPIQESKSSSAVWYSSQMSAASLRYEYGVSIDVPNIVWINGPYRPGDGRDVDIFKRDLKPILRNGERVIADKRFIEDNSCVQKSAMCTREEQKTWKKILKKHELIDKKLKSFSVVRDIFRHNIDQHRSCFQAVAALIHLEISSTAKPSLHSM